MALALGLATLHDHLLAGNVAAVAGLFDREPAIDTPLDGLVAGHPALDAFVARTSADFKARGATVEVLATIESGLRCVAEIVVSLRHDGGVIRLPVVAVGDRGGRAFRAIRLYHSTWPLTGGHRVRPPLLVPPTAPVAQPAILGRYFAAIGAAADVAGVLRLFSAEGYVREPSGEAYRHTGASGRRAFYEAALARGGVGLTHCTGTSAGRHFAIEYICDSWGTTRFAPQAGCAIYELADDGLIAAVRIYDDVNP